MGNFVCCSEREREREEREREREREREQYEPVNDMTKEIVFDEKED